MLRNNVLKEKSFSAGPICIAAIILLFIAFVPNSALAHKVYIYAWVEGDTIHTESYFSSNRKVQGGLIQVFDPSGSKLLEGHTNKNGEFGFKIPEKTDLKIVVNASMGHRGEYILKADELPDISVTTKGMANAGGIGSSSQSGVSVGTEEIRAIVGQVLDSRLGPVMRELVRLREERGPGLTEIIGGIGYIFGLMGLVMYFWGKKKRKGGKG